MIRSDPTDPSVSSKHIASIETRFQRFHSLVNEPAAIAQCQIIYIRADKGEPASQGSFTNRPDGSAYAIELLGSYRYIYKKKNWIRAWFVK